MNVTELRKGTFFEFSQGGYCFGRCLWLGVDAYGNISFVHMSAGGDKFVLNREIKEEGQEVTPYVDQRWKDETST